jgi:microcystin-dependent protein
MEGYIAEIRMFAAPFAPRNWAYCQGQIMSISQNSALFSLLGTTYGGNGIQTFGLPNFASRVAVGTGNGAGLSSITLGEMSGSENVTLLTSQIPQHNHVANGNVNPKAFNGSGDETNPSGGYPSNSTVSTGNLYSPSGNGSMGTTSVNVTVSPSGSSSPHPNFQPSLGMNYIICLYGIYPSRN